MSSLHIIDDDNAVRDSLEWLLRTHGIRAVGWASAEDFLNDCNEADCACLIIDIRMPGMSGVELFDRLRQRGWTVPGIFLTGHGDVPIAVQAIKDGAADFLEKPVDESRLLASVQTALATWGAQSAQRQRREELLQALASLTARERDIMSRVLAGKLNKVIADELGIAMRTVEVHRSRVFEKMGVRSAVELSQTLTALGEKLEM